MKKLFLTLLVSLFFVISAFAEHCYIVCAGDGTCWLLTINNDGWISSYVQISGCPAGNAWHEEVTCVLKSNVGDLPVSLAAEEALNAANLSTPYEGPAPNLEEFMAALHNPDVRIPKAIIVKEDMNQSILDYFKINNIPY